MRTTFTIAALALLTGAGCERIGDSGLNPANWLPDRTAADVAVGPAAAADPRPLVDRIADLGVTQTTDGVIVRATGLPARQGYFDGVLVPVASGTPGVLAFAFRLQPPPAATRVSTPASREVTIAAFVPNAAIGGVREIRVSGARDARSVRR